ncbi:hypothetical protein RvY_17703-2 [Ramazzottius varieornatus]|uniref:Kinesin motor domain-containing protein n=1 Tax=Ramazzottius varieornatus TaxID=947166 RepID=A0A1D1W334_RAMVA|nr:hypothetical protein RvY_17703-2 [Ramazzottius varieornatus]
MLGRYSRSAMKVQKRVYAGETEPVKVYCRLKPCPTAERCITRIDKQTILLTEPSSEARGNRNPRDPKEYKFSKVFAENADQKDVFDEVALPLLRDLIRGQNGLLFTYGVTSSGKTYTMMGDAKHPGLIPRTLDGLFASIHEVQAPLCVFKPFVPKSYMTQKEIAARLNGFVIQDEYSASQERKAQEKLKRKILQSTNGQNQGAFSGRKRDSAFPEIQVDNFLRYSVFVSYIEIYKDCVFDLLQKDDSVDANKPTTLRILKDLRRGVGGTYFVAGVNEIEVQNADEALALLERGQTVRQIASTKLNAESSRSHTIFNIRLVAAPIEDGVIQEDVFISLLSLVDLAGSERAKNTENGAERLKEAGKINNSLMGLRVMMETLRQKQSSKNGPIREKAIGGDAGFRHTKLGTLFQSFFDEQGTVKMIVCINPASNQYNELGSVLAFAEGTQDVRTALRDDPYDTKGRARKAEERERKRQEQALEESRQAERAKRKAQEMEASAHSTYQEEHSKRRSDITMTFHGFLLHDHTDTRTLPALAEYLEERIRRHKQMAASLMEQETEFARRLAYMTQQNTTLKRENLAFRAHLSHRDDQFDELYKKYQSLLEESNMNHQHKIDLGRELQDLMDAHEEERKEWQRRLQEESLRMEEDSDNFRDENSLEDRRKKQATASRVRTMVQRVNESGSTVTPSAPTISNSSTLDSSSRYQLRKTTIAKSSTSKKVTCTTDSANRQPPPHFNLHYNAGGVQRRSKGKLLMQSSKYRVPIGSILKPGGKAFRCSLSKTDPKMEDFQKVDNYALEHQDADSQGDLETHIITGKVRPTAGDGYAIVFDTVETLKQHTA